MENQSFEKEQNAALLWLFAVGQPTEEAAEVPQSQTDEITALPMDETMTLLESIGALDEMREMTWKEEEEGENYETTNVLE